MPVKVELTLEQIADAIKHLKKDEVEALELMLSLGTRKEILKRRKEARAGKTVGIEKLRSFKGV
jgi:hypothetical protein